jgi:hypothetical protein
MTAALKGTPRYVRKLYNNKVRRAAARATLVRLRLFAHPVVRAAMTLKNAALRQKRLEIESLVARSNRHMTRFLNTSFPK